MINEPAVKQTEISKTNEKSLIRLISDDVTPKTEAKNVDKLKMRTSKGVSSLEPNMLNFITKLLHLHFSFYRKFNNQLTIQAPTCGNSRRYKRLLYCNPSPWPFEYGGASIQQEYGKDAFRLK